jgi:hypothetical protein
MAPLTTVRRNALPERVFAGPNRTYPIDTANRARNALARVAQHGSPQLQARVRRAVARKFPGIKQQGES